MGLWNALKKFGKRKAGSWGRINTGWQSRRASKAIRREGKAAIKDATNR